MGSLSRIATSRVHRRVSTILHCCNGLAFYTYVLAGDVFVNDQSCVEIQLFIIIRTNCSNVLFLGT